MRFVGLVIGLRVRVRRTVEARFLEEALPVHVPNQNRLDDCLRRQTREADGHEGRVEEPQLEEVRGEFGIGRAVVGLGGKQRVLDQDVPGLLERGRTDRLDPLPEPGRREPGQPVVEFPVGRLSQPV